MGGSAGTDAPGGAGEAAGDGGESATGAGGMPSAGSSAVGGAGSAGAPVAGTGNTSFVCPPLADTIGIGCVVDSGDTLVDVSVAASVTVTSVEDTTTAICSTVGGDYPAKRIELHAADDRTWSVIVAIDGLPAELIVVDDAFDFSLDAAIDTLFYTTHNQTLALSHGADLVLFASSQEKFGTPPLPDLSAFDLGFTNPGVTCGTGGVGACLLNRALTVATGGESVTLAPGHSATIGGLVVNLDAAGETMGGGCDVKSETKIAGFRTP